MFLPVALPRGVGGFVVGGFFFFWEREDVGEEQAKFGRKM